MKALQKLSRLDVPKCARRVSATGKNLMFNKYIISEPLKSTRIETLMLYLLIWIGK